MLTGPFRVVFMSEEEDDDGNDLSTHSGRDSGCISGGMAIGMTTPHSQLRQFNLGRLVMSLTRRPLSKHQR
jgi:hypothetical protein